MAHPLPLPCPATLPPALISCSSGVPGVGEGGHSGELEPGPRYRGGAGPALLLCPAALSKMKITSSGGRRESPPLHAVLSWAHPSQPGSPLIFQKPEPSRTCSSCPAPGNGCGPSSGPPARLCQESKFPSTWLGGHVRQPCRTSGLAAVMGTGGDTVEAPGCCAGHWGRPAAR